MKKKLFTLGIIAPLFAISVSCANNVKRISFDEAFNFAVNNYDQYYFVGYEPIYIVKANKIAIQDTKLYKQVVREGARSYEQVYYIDTTVNDIASTIDSDEINLPHITSVVVRQIAHYLSFANVLLGYFESYFTLEANKYLGVCIESKELHQVINIAGGVLALTGVIDLFDDIEGYFDLITSDNAQLFLSGSCNNLGLVDRAHVSLEIENLSLVLGDELKEMIQEYLPIDFGVATSKSIILDLDIIVDYSNKQ